MRSLRPNHRWSVKHHSTSHLRRRFQINLLSISRGAQRLTTRLARTRFQVGNVLLLQGRAETLPEAVVQLGCLPLAEHYLTMGRKRPRLLSLVILVAVMALVALKLLPVEVAFFIAAVLVVLLRLLSPKEAYDAIDWPIVVMLGALIPVGESLQTTGRQALLGTG